MKKYILIILIFTLVFTSCKKSFLDLNQDPNTPTTVPSSSLISAALVNTSYIIVDGSLSDVQAWMGYWAFSSNYAVTDDRRNYKFTPSTYQGLFSDLYTNAYDYQKIIDFAIQQNNPALEGIGRTMKSFLMQYAVDVYNDVPYSDAFKGTFTSTPKYDKGQAVYESIYDDLTKAINKLKSASSTSFPNASQDLLFQGKQSLWIKFANTIKLRLLIRQANRADRASYIQSKLADFTDGLNSFLQAGEIAFVNPGFSNSTNKQTPFWAFFGYTPSGTKGSNNDFYKAAQNEIDFYSSQKDGRLTYVAKPVGKGGLFGQAFLGNEMGQQGDGSTTYSDVMNNDTAGINIGRPVRTANDNAPIMTDFESLFLQSEAVERGWFTGGDAAANSLYSQALAQSFNYDFGPVYGPIYLSKLVSTADNDWSSASNKIKLIITQKWAALNELNFFEPWAEYRRTGFPAIPLSSSAGRGPNIPVRFLYPQREYDLNGANVNAEGNIDQFSSKIWWMP